LSRANTGRASLFPLSPQMLAVSARIETGIFSAQGQAGISIKGNI